MGLQQQRQVLQQFAAFMTFLCLLSGVFANLHHIHHLCAAYSDTSHTAWVTPDSECLLCRYEAQFVSPATAPTLTLGETQSWLPIPELSFRVIPPPLTYPGFVSSPRSPPEVRE